MTKKLRHRHWPLGWLACLLRPCGVALSEETRRATYESFADRKRELRAAVAEERDRLYRMIDDGADIDDDPLLAHIARNRGTLQGEVRRVPNGDHTLAALSRAVVEAERQREARLDRLRRGEH